MTKNDVVIIGCGIAGGICALKLLNDGFNVKIIEKSSKIGMHNQTKIDIAENTSLDSIIKELKLNFFERSDKSKWFSKNNHFLFESKIYDLFVKRGPAQDSFDNKLANKIRDHGIEIETNSTFKDFIFKNSSISTIKVKNKNQTKEIKGKYFVGADGSNPATLERIKLKSQIKKGVEIIGYGFVSKELNMPEKITHVIFDSQLAPNGYFFIANTGKGLCVASIVSTRDSIKKPLDQYFNDFVKNNTIVSNIFSDIKPSNYFTGSCNTGILENRTFKNFCVVGDAAYVMDPIFGYGVRPAIISGYLAAQEIENNLENNKGDLTNYNNSINKVLLSNEKISYLIRDIFYKLNNKDFDFIVQSVNYINKAVNLDQMLDHPQRHLDLLLKILFKNFVSSGRLGGKIITSLVSSY